MGEVYHQLLLVPREDTKRCTRCKVVKAVGEFFRVKRGKYLSSWCKACRTERNAAYLKDYQERNREKLRPYKAAKAREYRAADPEKARIVVRQYRADHPDRVLAANRKWLKAHPGFSEVAYQRQKVQKPTYGVSAQAKRRALHASAPINDYTDAQWNATLLYFQGYCAYCGEPMDVPTREHMMPLSRGGGHTDSNIVPACKHCNSTKGNKTLVEFLLMS